VQSKQSYITYDFLKGKKAYLELFRCISRKSGDKEVSIHFHLELLLLLSQMRSWNWNALSMLSTFYLQFLSLSLSLTHYHSLSLSLSSVYLRPALVSRRELDISHVRIADGILHTLYANRRKNKRLVKMRVHNITA
jgi:hypothetical protein